MKNKILVLLFLIFAGCAIGPPYYTSYGFYGGYGTNGYGYNSGYYMRPSVMIKCFDNFNNCKNQATQLCPFGYYAVNHSQHFNQYWIEVRCANDRYIFQ